MDTRANQGFIIEDEVWAKFDQYHKQLHKVIEKYQKSPSRVPDSWIIGNEYNVGDGKDHNAYIDLLLKEPTGETSIWDFKCKMYLKSESFAGEMLTYRQDWQLMHYGYFYWQQSGILPARYYIGMPVLGPTPAFVGGIDISSLGVYSYSKDQLERWHDSACAWWALMEQCENQQWAPMSASHTGRYGNCEYYDACFTHQQNPDMMQGGYIQVERSR